MKTRRWITLGVIAAQVSFAAVSLPANEPIHQGRPVAYWVAALDSGPSVSSQPKQVEAEEAIHALGPDAIPSILAFHDRDREKRLRLIRHACAIIGAEGDLKLLDALQDTEAVRRETALEVLSSSAMPAALDDITRLLADPVRAVRTAAVRALVRLAPDRGETVVALVEELQSNRSSASGDAEFTRADAALALGNLGPKARASVPELTELLTDSDDEVREAAAVALWKIDRATQAIPALVERLDGARDYQTCIRVLKMLAEMGPSAKAAVPVIRKRIEDPGVSFVPANVNLGHAALEALQRIDAAAAAELRKEHPELSTEAK